MLVVLSLRWRLQTRPAKSARCMLTRWGCWYCWQYRLVEREEVEYNSPGPAVRPQSLQNTALSWSYKDHWLRSVGPPPLGTSSWCLMWTTVEGCTCWGNSQDRTLWSLGPERRDSGQQGNSQPDSQGLSETFPLPHPHSQQNSDPSRYSLISAHQLGCLEIWEIKTNFWFFELSLYGIRELASATPRHWSWTWSVGVWWQ